MTMIVYVDNRSVDVYYVDPDGGWVTGRNHLKGREKDPAAWEQLVREMRMVRTGEWGTAPDGWGRWAAEVAWMAGVAGE